MKEFVTYEEFGAKGDGVTDDFAAISSAHKAANEAGLPIRANDGSTWHGDVVIKNTKIFGYEREWHPARILELKNPSKELCVFHTSRRDWDFGYTCYMPTSMTIENLQAGPDGKADLICYKFGAVTVPCEKNPYVMAKKVVGKKIAAEKFSLSNREDVLPKDTVECEVALCALSDLQ